MDMVCDKDQGFCVECITQVDCSLDQLCQDYICVTPFCLPEEPGCDSNSVVVCNATGTEWVSVQVCGENQYCVDAACQDQICEPGALFCEGPLLLTCNDMGSAIIDEVDCSDDGLYCSGGECVNCQPECTGKECGDDGCGGTCGSCPDNTPCVGGFCPNPCELAEYEGGSQGCEFWSLDLDNIEGGQYEKIGLVVAVPAGNGAAEIVIDGFKMGIPLPVSASELEVDNLSVAEGDYKIFTLPSGYDLDGSSVTSSSFRLTANVPVRAYQFNPLNSNSVFTSDASLLFPSHQAGNEYIALSWKQRVQGYKLRGNIAILAIHAGTTSVSVKVASVIKGNPPIPSASPGNTITLSLQQGQVINLETDGDQGSDLTGSIVSSDHPVMVYGAHECANIPLGTNYCDHIEQQLPAISKWGTHYIGDTFEPRSPNQTDIWRVISGADNVAIQFTPAVHGPTMLQKGDSVEFATGEHFELTATGPVEVGHYLTGSNHAGFTTYAGCSGGTGIGDPAFTIAIPVERHALSHQVLTPPDYELNYLNIMGPLEAQQGVSIDGEPISTPMTAIGETGLGVARIPVEAGFHVIESESIEIGVTAYGYACDVSYAYPGTWSGISQ